MSIPCVGAVILWALAFVKPREATLSTAAASTPSGNTHRTQFMHDVETRALSLKRRVVCVSRAPQLCQLALPLPEPLADKKEDDSQSARTEFQTMIAQIAAKKVRRL